MKIHLPYNFDEDEASYGGIWPSFDDPIEDLTLLRQQIEAHGSFEAAWDDVTYAQGAAVRTGFRAMPPARRAKDLEQRGIKWRAKLGRIRAKKCKASGWKTPQISSYTIEDKRPHGGDMFILLNPRDEGTSGRIFTCFRRANTHIADWNVGTMPCRVKDAVWFVNGREDWAEHPNCCFLLRGE
jgi:hypothetical protein